MNKGVKFRAYPDKQQQNLINQALGCCRLVYNKGLAMRNEAFANGIVLGFKRLRFEIDIKHNKVFAGRGSFNGNIVDMSHRHRLPDFQIAQLREFEILTYNANIIVDTKGSVGLMVVMLALEQRVFCSLLEEILKTAIQITQRLLQCNRVYVLKKREFLFFF